MTRALCLATTVVLIATCASAQTRARTYTNRDLGRPMATWPQVTPRPQDLAGLRARQYVAPVIEAAPSVEIPYQPGDGPYGPLALSTASTAWYRGPDDLWYPPAAGIPLTYPWGPIYGPPGYGGSPWHWRERSGQRIRDGRR